MLNKSRASARCVHPVAVPWIGVFTILALSLSGTSRASAYTPTINGLYALGSAMHPEIPAAALANPAVDGIALRFFWDQLEPSEGAFDWAPMDRAIGSARAHGKKVSFSVTPGVHTPAWVYGAGAAPFTYLWNRPFGFAQCSEQRIPIPWDRVYLAKWSTFVRAMGRRYGSNPAVAMVKITGINSGAAEINLPHTGGMGAVNCPGGNNDDANWRRVGYSRAKIKAAFQASGDVFAESFPIRRSPPESRQSGFRCSTMRARTAVADKVAAALARVAAKVEVVTGKAAAEASAKAAALGKVAVVAEGCLVNGDSVKVAVLAVAARAAVVAVAAIWVSRRSSWRMAPAATATASY